MLRALSFNWRIRQFCSQIGQINSLYVISSKRVGRRAHKEICIEELADTLNVSPRTLWHRYKSELGISPQKYLQRQRLEVARQRLETGTQSVKQVIVEVGSVDRAAFSHLFKHHFGVTKGAFRGQITRTFLGFSATFSIS